MLVTNVHETVKCGEKKRISTEVEAEFDVSLLNHKLTILTLTVIWFSLKE